jgi:pimeloyl-ACP methyl ester carboxylesterase
MGTVISKDGTRIAYDKRGQGPALILVDGALCYRAMGPSGPLADLLAPRFTVYTYDRRGRGESGDAKPYAVEREIEDMEALIGEAGRSAYVYGISSGAALALEAAARLKGIKKLALYEAPFIVDDSLPPRPDDLLDRMDALVTADRRGDAVKLFMRTVGTPAIFILMMQFMPAWSQLKGIAHTIPYDFRVLGDTGSGKPLPAGRWASVTIPTLVMDGGKSPAWMRHAMQSLAGILADARYRTLEGQTHLLKPEVVAPELGGFFA